jgi:hypothetical protein
MYVYIKDNKIQEIVKEQIAARDGYTELDIPDADIELTNNLQYLVYENGAVERREHTQEEFQTLTEQNKNDPRHYALKRKLAYPSIEEQLDYIYHHGIDAWKNDMVDPVKAEYPKV